MAKNRPRRGSPLNLTSAFGLFGQSYQLIKRHFDVFMVLFSIGGLLALWETLGRYTEDDASRNWITIVLKRIFVGNVDTSVFAASGFMLIIATLYVIAYLLITIAVLRAAQGRKISFTSLWREFNTSWLWLKLVFAFILFGLSIIVGLLLLIIPGLILLWRLFFVPYILIDHKTTIYESFRQSWRMTQGFAGAIYGVIAVALLLSMTSILPIFGPLVAFVLSAIYTAAPALRYQEIKKLS